MEEDKNFITVEINAELYNRVKKRATELKVTTDEFIDRALRTKFGLDKMTKGSEWEDKL